MSYIDKKTAVLVVAVALALLAITPALADELTSDTDDVAASTTAESVHTAQAGAHSLEVQVTGLRNDTGSVRVAVYDNPDAFPDERDKLLEAKSVEIPSGAESVTLTFSLPSGQYAVAMLHDENDSGDMDKNLVGVPEEGYGVSLNPDTGLTGPDWEDSAFELDGDKEIEISVKYF